MEADPRAPSPVGLVFMLVFMNPTHALSLGGIFPMLTSSLFSPYRVFQDSVPTVPGIHEDPSIQGQPAAAAGPGEGAAPVLPAKSPGVGGTHPPPQGLMAPWLQLALLRWLRCPHLGTVSTRAERRLGGPQPGHVPRSLGQVQRGHDSLEGGWHKAP